MSELEDWLGQPLWRLAMQVESGLDEERAKAFYGFSMVSKTDIQVAFPPTLDGIMSAVQLRKKMVSENAFLNVLADDI